MCLSLSNIQCDGLYTLAVTISAGWRCPGIRSGGEGQSFSVRPSVIQLSAFSASVVICDASSSATVRARRNKPRHVPQTREGAPGKPISSNALPRPAWGATSSARQIARERCGMLPRIRLDGSMPATCAERWRRSSSGLSMSAFQAMKTAISAPVGRANYAASMKPVAMRVRRMLWLGLACWSPRRITDRVRAPP